MVILFHVFKMTNLQGSSGYYVSILFNKAFNVVFDPAGVVVDCESIDHFVSAVDRL